MTASLSAGALTLLDMATRSDPDGGPATVIESLAQKNEITMDATWIEGNLPTGERTTVRTTLPTISSRQLNAGVTPGKSTTDQFTDSCAILESYSPVDIKLVDMAPNPAQFRAGEDDAFIEAFAQKFASLLVAGNAITTPSDFTGLEPRYNDTDGATGQNVLDAGGASTDNLSILLVGWGPRAITGVYPRGGMSGLKMTDKGEQIWQTSTTFGAATSAFRAYVTWFEWVCGLAVKDWRYAVRIANVSLADLKSLATTQALTAYTTSILTLMIKAYYLIPQPSSVKLVYYMNRTLAYNLHNAVLQKVAPATLTFETVAGKPVMMYMGIPVRIVDQLGIAETRVTSSTVSI